MIIVLIGVAGSGKTTVGRLLARRLGWTFYEGDDFHSPGNIAKMTRGQSLDDEDRKPWLRAIRDLINKIVERGENAVIACSALKQSYRRFLVASGEVVFVYLKAESPLVRERVKRRVGHFIHPALIESQFDALEEPDDALQVDASLSPVEIVRIIREKLHLKPTTRRHERPGRY
ncbi:MAG TPA: gluconokinase [Candidatus Binatia bacterium]|nr:gluconokinase [Candidatus Binatia bacterium]